MEIRTPKSNAVVATATYRRDQYYLEHKMRENGQPSSFGLAYWFNPPENTVGFSLGLQSGQPIYDYSGEILGRVGEKPWVCIDGGDTISMVVY